MKNIIYAKMSDVLNFDHDNESLPVRNFESIELETLDDLTPARVKQILDRYWSPDGFVAWNLNGNVLETVYFKGRAAVVTKFVDDDITVKEILLMTTSLGHLDRRQVIRTLCA